jgi:diguanylate cyclase (GGDEF)-like protein
MSETSSSRRPGLRSLPGQISTLVFAASLVACLVVTFVSTHTIRSFLREKIDQKFPRILRTSGQQIELWYAQRELDLEVFARSQVLVQNLGSRPAEAGALREIAAYLEYVLGRSPVYAGFLVLDAKGDPVGAVGEPLRSDWLLSSPASERATTHPLVFVEGERVQALSIEIRGADGAAAGSFHARLDPRALDRLLRDPRLAESGDLYLVGARGELVTPASAGAPGTRLGRALPAPADVPVVEELVSETGERIVACAAPLGRFGWTLVVEERSDSAFAPVTGVLRRSVVLNLTTVACLSLVAFSVAAWRVRPLDQLARAAGRIAQGELEVAIPPSSSGDEIGTLTRAFQEMIGRLAAHRAVLERQQEEIEEANGRLRLQNDELQRMNEALGQLSITDGLTKLHNHRYFQDELPREVKRSQRTGAPLSLVLVDIDDFKKLNDSLGHAAGDTVLAHIASVMQQAIRDTDLLARYGGEEFVLLAPQTDLSGACRLAEKLRRDIAENPPPVVGPQGSIRVTVSMGVAQLRSSARQLFDEADRALYRAKQSGKDCLCLAEPEVLPEADGSPARSA